MDTAAQNKSLDNDYGTTHGPNSPTSFLLALYVGDPENGGVELANQTEVDVVDASGVVTGTQLLPNGYAPAAVAHADFAAATAGVKATTAPVQFADATQEWPDTVTHWQLVDAGDGTRWDAGLLAEDGLTVTGAGPGPTVAVSIFYADAVDEPA